MSKIDRVLRELGDLYEMYRVIKRYRMPANPTSSALRETQPVPAPKFDTPPQPR
jgi:hypothetical protein